MWFKENNFNESELKVRYIVHSTAVDLPQHLLKHSMQF